MSLDTVERAAPPTEVARVETPQKRRQRISTGCFIGVVGVLLLIGLASTAGSARFALSDAFDEVQLPTSDGAWLRHCHRLCAALPVGRGRLLVWAR